MPARQLDGDIDAGGPAVRGHDAIDQKRLLHGDVADARQVFVTQRIRLGHQVLDHQIIAICPGVLKIGQRVHTRGIGYLPGLFGQLRDRLQNMAVEHRARFGQ